MDLLRKLRPDAAAHTAHRPPLQLQRMRCYFLYNVPVTEQIFSPVENWALGVTPQLIQRFDVRPADVPAFYTAHYRTEHAPYLISDPQGPQQTFIPKEKLAALGFFSELNLSKDINVSWEFTLALQNAGLITLRLDIKEPLPSNPAYHLGGLHLNPEYTVVATEPIQHLWAHTPDTRPEFITLDDLARAIHAHFFTACGLNAHRYRALRHEIQIPFMAVDVETSFKSQFEFLEQASAALVELVFKPACWEIEQPSLIHADSILGESRLWSVAQDTLLIAAYEGVVYIKLKTFDTGAAHQVSGYELADESSVLHTFKVAVSNYHFLRILDDMLDKETRRLIQTVGQYQRALHTAPGDENNLLAMNEFAIQMRGLRFELVDLLEEINNSDKLIDEEWHIALLDKLNVTMGISAWFDSVNKRVDNLRELAQTVENAYAKLTNLGISRNIERFNGQLLQMNIESEEMQNRMRRAEPFFAALAAVEALNLLISIWFDSTYPLTAMLSQWLQLPLGFAVRFLGTLGVLLALFLTIGLIRWVAARWGQHSA